MDLTMPVPGPPTKANNTLTILLDGRGRAFGYQGVFDPASTVLQPLNDKAFRNTLRVFRELNERAGTSPVCIVKTSEGARYGSVVAAVDELHRANITRFSVQDDLYEEERTLLAAMKP